MAGPATKEKCGAGCPDSAGFRDAYASTNGIVRGLRVGLPPTCFRKTASIPRATTGENVTYQITVSNPTIAAIGSVAVCDAIPSGLLYLRASPDANVRTGNPCWTITRLGASRSERFTVIANVAPGFRGKLVNRATASAPGVRVARATAAVTVTSAPQVPCSSASDASATGRSRLNSNTPVAKAAC